MKKTELRRMLKPLVKECVRETLLQEGVLSNIVSEVAQGLGNKTIVASKQHVTQPAQQNINEQQEAKVERQKIQETRKRMLDAIGTESYNGVDLFEGTAPGPQESDQPAALSGIDPSDAGVDINKIFGGTSKNWSHMFK